MKYQISGKQIDIGAALQGHVEAELGESVRKYAERPTDAQVIFSKSGHEFVCEATVHLSTGLTAQAKASERGRTCPILRACRKDLIEIRGGGKSDNASLWTRN